MNRFKIATTVFAIAALSLAGNTQSARADSITDTIALNLQINNYLNLEVEQDSVTVEPTLNEIVTGSATRTGLFNLIKIRSTDNYDVTVVGSSGTLNNSDIELNAGDGAVTVSAAPQNILTNESGPANDTSYSVDVTINNLKNYPTGNYSNTLTFEIVPSDEGAPAA